MELAAAHLDRDVTEHRHKRWPQNPGTDLSDSHSPYICAAHFRPRGGLGETIHPAWFRHAVYRVFDSYADADRRRKSLQENSPDIKHVGRAKRRQLIGA